jgi:hypothetical protein
MPRSKTQISKLPKALREPIEFGRPSVLWSEAEFNAWLKQRNAFVLNEKVGRLELLMRQLKIPGDVPQIRMLFLCLNLAERLYPGFRTTADGAKPQGRPRRGAADADQQPPELTLFMVDQLRKAGAAKRDVDACKMLLGYRDENKKLSRSELERKAKSMATMVSTMRALGRKKAANQVN